MSGYPTRYQLTYDFVDFQQNNPTTPLPADQLEIQFNDLQLTTDEIINSLIQIQRSDGALANNSVGNDQLKSEVTVGVNAAVDWQTGVDYESNDTVYENNNVYRCLIAHTAGVFATDLGNGNWTEILDFNQFLSQSAADVVAVEADLAAVEAVLIDVMAVEADAAAVEADLVLVEADLVAVEADAVAVEADLVSVQSLQNINSFPAITTLESTDQVPVADASDSNLSKKITMANFTSYLNTVLNSSLSARKNMIINGEFGIWQRGISFTNISDSSYPTDRFYYKKSGSTLIHSISRSTDIPSVAQSGRLFKYSLLADCTTADAAPTAGVYCHISQAIEGYNWVTLAQRITTLSFWVKATKTGIYCAALRNGPTPDRSCVMEYTINVANTWEYKTITFPASPAAGTWNYNGLIGVILSFTLVGGSTFQTTPGAWQTGNFFSTSNQVNGCDNTANDFRICAVQLEAGSVSTPFEQRFYQDELSLCKRYHENSYYISETNVGSITVTAPVTIRNNVANKFFSFVPLNNFMNNPNFFNIIIFNPNTGATMSVRDNTSGTNIPVGIWSSAVPIGFSIYNTSGTIPEGILITFHFVAEFEFVPV